MTAQRDDYAAQAKAITAFGDQHETITPDDTDPLVRVYKYIVCGSTAGTVACIDKAGVTATYYLNAGQPLPVRPMIIKSTGTSATPLIGVYDYVPLNP